MIDFEIEVIEFHYYCSISITILVQLASGSAYFCGPTEMRDLILIVEPKHVSEDPKDHIEIHA